MKDWKEYKFSDFVDINPKVALKSNQEYSFVEMKDLNENNKHCEPSQIRELKGGARFEEGDTLFARITPCLENGKICQVRNLEKGVGFGSTEFLVFRGRKGISDSNFVFYLSRYDDVRNFAESNFDGTSGRQRVPKDAFNNLYLLLPPLPTQKAIATTLSRLDAKIDLLHRQNQTLEQLAETLFRKWFVEDAKEDWKVSQIGCHLTTILGGTPATSNTEYWNGDVPWINSGEINKFRIVEGTKYITKLGLEKSNTKLLPKGTTVIAITGATLGQISLLEIDTCANQSVVGILPNNQFPKEFVFFWIKYKLKEIILNETGGAQPHINKNDVNEAELIIPPEEALKKAIPIISNYFDKITKNVFQIKTLTQLRDSLLPQLMSGAVTVKA